MERSSRRWATTVAPTTAMMMATIDAFTVPVSSMAKAMAANGACMAAPSMAAAPTTA